MSVMLLLGASLPSSILAQASERLSACFVPKTGIVYRVNDPATPGLDPDLADGCRSPGHVLFSWGEEGPPGPQGEAGTDGVSGWEIVTQDGGRTLCGPVSGCNSSTRFAVACPAGKVVLSGGHRVEVVSGFLREGTTVDESYPSAPDRWAFSVTRYLAPNTEAKLHLYVVCASVG